MQQYIENNDIENKLAVEIRDESLKVDENGTKVNFDTDHEDITINQDILPVLCKRNTPIKVNSMVASMSVPNDPFGRLYAKSRVMQEEGKKRRKDIAKKVAPKNIVFKTISAKKASALYNRLFLNADHRKTTLIQDSKEKFHEKKTSGLEITKVRKTALFTRLYEDASLRLHKSKETAFIKTIKQGQGVMSITEARKTALFTRLYEDASLRLRKAEEAAMIKATFTKRIDKVSHEKRSSHGCMEVCIPPGDMSIILSSTPDGLMIEEISNKSVAKNRLHVGDKIISLDGVDVS